MVHEEAEGVAGRVDACDEFVHALGRSEFPVLVPLRYRAVRHGPWRWRGAKPGEDGVGGDGGIACRVDDVGLDEALAPA